ncbi:MAG: hypothetical protein KatS3mg105_0636 [Gemmatales bacterium]|nr:MAG: hypothetical protein KatS3mg105_0636 [Gemmatales bacterium]
MSNQDHNKNGPGMSRRQFLKGTGAGAAVSALATAPLPTVDAQDRLPGMGPGPVKVSFTVNGAKVTTPPIEPRVTLLDALRNYLDVTGCKRVCDRGSCGACTVLLDGRPIYACSMLALEAQGAEHPNGRVAERGWQAGPGTGCV